MNKEIYNKFRSPDIVTVIEVCRLEWLGHIVRMDGERTVQTLPQDEPEGESKRGRPRLGWMGVVEREK
jgi:hypothetical protein